MLNSGLELTTGYKFSNQALLEEALTHTSCLGADANSKTYERLEFLGDSALSFVIARTLFHNFPTSSEGELSKRRASLIKGRTLFEIGSRINLLEYVNISRNKARLTKREAMKIVENVLEALVGAIYVDGGLQACEAFVLAHWNEFLKQDLVQDPKTRLQEWGQKRGIGLPKYVLVGRSGQDNDPVFQVSVMLGDMPEFVGFGSSKREAEEEAARLLVQFINTNYE